ncbi:MAG: glycine cleavage T C-terminal barrel domain-containing protein [Chloroflexota bacterium]
MRVTYVGELGYELHIPADQALTVYDQLFEAGEAFGLRNVGLGAMSSLRMEKAYRDYQVDIDNTDTPIDVGLGFAVAWDKPGGFVGREALLELRKHTPPPRRMVHVLCLDAEPLLYGHEPLYRGGKLVGHNRFGAYGHTLGGSVGLAMLEDEAGIPAAGLDGDDYEIEIVGKRFPARVSLKPLYDPERARILA